VSHSELAYRTIKRKIITLELKPLAVIDKQALMENLQLGRTPIREALHRLAMENLVINAPRRGMFVAKISVGAFHVLWVYAVSWIGVAPAHVLNYTAPAFTVLFAWLLWHEPITRP
jgi:drug/metabolite transporter (DMT)-like permease